MALIQSFVLNIMSRKHQFTILALVAAISSIYLIPTADAYQRPLHLNVRLTGRYPSDFKVPYDPGMTGLQLAQEVGDYLGIEYQYLVLYRLDRPIKVVDQT